MKDIGEKEKDTVKENIIMEIKNIFIMAIGLTMLNKEEEFIKVLMKFIMEIG
jgi:hypothetical protein